MTFVDRLEESLKARGLDILIDRRDIHAFEDWWKRIESLIAQADTVVFVLSPDAVSPASICQKEVSFAASLNKRFAPVVWRAVEAKEVPAPLARLNFIFFQDENGYEENVDRLVEGLTTDLDWVRKHTELTEAARRWAAAGRPGPRGLLLRSPLLEEAERWIAQRPSNSPPPTAETQGLILESRRAATQRRNVLSAGLGVGLLLATALSGLAYWQRGIALEQERIAEAQRRIAVQQERAAVEQRDHALKTQSLLLADFARQQHQMGNAGAAVLLALEALPDTAAGVTRPYAPEAERQLEEAIRTLRDRFVFNHGSGIVSAGFSSDGKHIISGSFDRTAYIWDARSGEKVHSLESHGDGIHRVAFSRNGKVASTHSYDGFVRIWDSEIGAPIAKFGPAVAAALSPSGGHAGIISNGKLQLWDVKSARQIWDGPIGEASRPHVELTFSPDGQYIATLVSSILRLWDTRTGTYIWEMHTEHRSNHTALEFSPDGSRILTASADPLVRLWRAKTGEPIVSLPDAHTAAIVRAALSADGEFFVTASEDKTARIWNDFGEPVGEPLVHPDEVRGVAFSPDGKMIVTSSGTDVWLWDASTGKALGPPLRGHQGNVYNVLFSPDGNSILSVSDDSTARLWHLDPPHKRRPRIFKGQEAVTTATLSPDGKRIATGSTGELLLWDVDTGREIGNRLQEIASLTITDVAFSPSTSVVAAVTGDVHLWDYATTKQIGLIERPTDASGVGAWPFTSVVFSPDGKRILTGAEDKTARVWDAASLKPIGRPLVGHAAPVVQALFSRDGRLILTLARKDFREEDPPRLWDATTGEQVGEALKVPYDVEDAAFSPDGTHIALAYGSVVELWDVGTRAPLSPPFQFKEEFVTSVAFTADGKRLLIGSAPMRGSDKPIRYVDIASRKEVAAPLMPHRSAGAKRLAVTPDGRYVLTTPSVHDPDDGARLWKIFVTTQELVDTAKQNIPRCLTAADRVKFFLPPEPPLWCIEMKKWPYDTPSWSEWLAYKRANGDPPLPVSSEWQNWIGAQRR